MTMFRIVKVSILFFLFLIPLDASAESTECRYYNIEELNHLYHIGSYTETIERIQDIPPLERDQKWEDLLKKTATAVIKENQASSDYYDNFFFASERLKQFPSLQKDPEFIAELHKSVELALVQCDESCIPLLLSYLRFHENGEEIALQQGVRMYSSVSSKNSLLGIFNLATINGNKDACENSMVQSVVATGSKSSVALNRELSKAIVVDNCTSTSFDSLGDLLASDEGVRELLCEELVENSQLSGINQKICKMYLED
jgi:hypothetical protein